MLKSVFGNGGIKSMTPQILQSEVASNTIGKFSNSYKMGQGYEQNARIFGRAAEMDKTAAAKYLKEQSDSITKKAADTKSDKAAMRYAQQQADIGTASSLLDTGDHKTVLGEAKKAASRQRDEQAGIARDTLKEFPGMAKDYFIGGDMKQNAARIGTAAGLYMGAAAGARYVSGGGMTYNNQGQRDIAGIPFI